MGGFLLLGTALYRPNETALRRTGYDGSQIKLHFGTGLLNYTPRQADFPRGLPVAIRRGRSFGVRAARSARPGGQLS
jgi:hypothetical protein